MLYKAWAFLFSAFALICVCGTCIIFIEWVVHKNVEGGANNFDYKGKLDPHHWQYGVLLSCMYVFAPASSNETGLRGAFTVVSSCCLNTLKGVVFGVYLHGLWSYGPDPMMREKGGIRGMWGAGFVWFAVLAFFSAVCVLRCVNLTSKHDDDGYQQLSTTPNSNMGTEGELEIGGGPG